MSAAKRRGRRPASDLSEARSSVAPLRPSAAGPTRPSRQAGVQDEVTDDELTDDDAIDDELTDDEPTERPSDGQASATGTTDRTGTTVEDDGSEEVTAEEERDAATGDGTGDGTGAAHPLAGGGARRAGTGRRHLPRFRAFRRLYGGGTSFDFVGRRRLWFAISTVIIVAGIVSLGVRGFNFGIDFKGGTSWTVQAPGISASRAQSVVQADGVPQPVVEVLGGKTLEVQADLNTLPKAQQKLTSAKVTRSLADLAHTDTNNVSTDTVGPTWGGQVSKKALEALIAFLVVVSIYISLRFEWRMAVAAIVAVIHDLLVTAGVYSLSGLQVTPDTVIAVLTILGYSLYDTVVVFDRVRENSKNFGTSGRMTYSDMVNLSMNQTLARSVNTSLVAILPVLSVLLIGAEILGATTLQEFGLALFIGLLSGAYSSIFIASPVLAILKEHEPRYQTIRRRIETRGDRLGILTPSAAAALAIGGGGVGGGRGPRPAGGGGGALRPGGTRSRNGLAGGTRPASGADDGAGAATGARAAAGRSGEPARAGAAAGARPAGGRAGGTSGTRRPPPRPRKGGGKGKAKKRRR